MRWFGLAAIVLALCAVAATASAGFHVTATGQAAAFPGAVCGMVFAFARLDRWVPESAWEARLAVAAMVALVVNLLVVVLPYFPAYA